MKNLLKLICIVVLFFSVNSCGVQWQINSYNPDYVDENYQIEEINTVSQLRWKLQTDWVFADNYYRYLQRQNYSFFHNQFYRNRLYRYGWQSPHNYWLNWEWSYHFGYGYNNMWNQYPYYGNWGSSYWYWNQWNNPWQYSYTYGPRTQYLGNVYGRRSSYRNRSFISNSNRSRSILVSDGSTSDSRTYLPNTASPIQNQIIRNNKPRVLPTTKPPVVTRPPVIINKPVRNNPIRNNNRPRINSSSSRPNFNRPVSRPSSPKTTTNSSRKRNNPR